METVAYICDDSIDHHVLNFATGLSYTVITSMDKEVPSALSLPLNHLASSSHPSAAAASVSSSSSLSPTKRGEYILYLTKSGSICWSLIGQVLEASFCHISLSRALILCPFSFFSLAILLQPFCLLLLL